ncbi:hypothetical protein K3495_g7733 [Podosphaera aphanis]|nr:hypothetical protein K3495_g7733 [Podosphaera aphanis]
MKQGEHQLFSKFLNDFEFTLAQARGLNWDGNIKIIFLYAGLNPNLIKALYSKELTEEDYALFIKQVQQTASRVEANESYIQRRGSKTTSTLFNGQSENFNRPSHEAFAASGISSGENIPKLDSDGDVVMSGINGINMETLTAIVNAVKTDSGKGRAGNS